VTQSQGAHFWHSPFQRARGSVAKKAFQAGLQSNSIS